MISQIDKKTTSNPLSQSTSQCACVSLQWDNYTIWGWMRSVVEFLWVCLYNSGLEEGADGTREEEPRDVGEWFSRWDLIWKTMHPKETFSHGLISWIQIHPCPPALFGKDICTLLQPIMEKPSSSVFFFVFFTLIQSQIPAVVTSW